MGRISSRPPASRGKRPSKYFNTSRAVGVKRSTKIKELTEQGADLTEVVSQAQRDALPELAGCGTADVIRLFREHGFPVHPTTDALIFTTDIGKDWRSYILARDT